MQEASFMNDVPNPTYTWSLLSYPKRTLEAEEGNTRLSSWRLYKQLILIIVNAFCVKVLAPGAVGINEYLSERYSLVEFPFVLAAS